MHLKEYLYFNIKNIIQSWKDPCIYAISFLVYANENTEYQGLSNYPEFSIGYNTEKDCRGAKKQSEERWNYAFWRQNNVPLIHVSEAPKGAALLWEWFNEQQIKDVGEVDESQEYDDEMNYIGKGPTGYYELLQLVSEIARSIQCERKDNNLRPIPIIVHDLDYSWYVAEATETANPYGEAEDFLKDYKKGFM